MFDAIPLVDGKHASHTLKSLLCLGVLLGTSLVATGEEPEWRSVMSQIEPSRDGVVGQWSKTSSQLVVQAAQGARLMLPMEPVEEYDLRVRFTRRTGMHSVGLVVVHQGRQVVFEVDAWGKHLAGFQNVDGKTIEQNVTRRDNMQLQNGKTYTLVVQVRKSGIRGTLDDQEIAKLLTDGSNLNMHDVWRLPRSDRMGLVAWEAETVFHDVQWRPLGAAASVAAAKSASPMRAQPTPAQPVMREPAQRTSTSKGRKVLIVIANQDFFYREYFDPRQELERAGFQVTVAAGEKGICRPHPNSGQTVGNGEVMADAALRDLKADNFEAILFSGGWGASSYQFAFNGRYDEPSYNGNPSIKQEANRLINEFIAQDKYVCALCNGVSVLAWARVNGRSPLNGKQVVAPVREAPRGIYNGRPAQPSCRWHPESNGARLNPAGRIGDPSTTADDVLVDGKIITGEDDPSARAMGQKIVEVLSKP